MSHKTTCSISLTKLCCFLIFPVAFQFSREVIASNHNLENLSNTVRDSIVYLKVEFVDPNNSINTCGEKQGSAFVVSSDGYVLTAKHNIRIVDQCESFTDIRISGRIGYRYTAAEIPMTVIAEDANADVALLKFAERADPYVHVEVCDAKSIRVGAGMAAFGFPRDTDFSPLPTIYSNSSGARWQVSSDFTNGMSGGPVFNYSGEVIGVIQGGIANTPAIRYVIPLRHAANMIDLSGAEFSYCVDDSSPNSANSSEGRGVARSERSETNPSEVYSALKKSIPVDTRYFGVGVIGGCVRLIGSIRSADSETDDICSYRQEIPAEFVGHSKSIVVVGGCPTVELFEQTAYKGMPLVLNLCE